MTDERNLAPVPGDSPWGWVTMAVLSALALVAFMVVGFISLDREGLGPTLIGLIVILAVSGIGLGYLWLQRQDYLRKVRNGDVIERRKWDGSDVPGPNTYN